MFIMEKPYVSQLMVETILQHDWSVLDNEAVEESGIEEGAFRLWSTEKATDNYLKQEYPLIYSNSENAVSWVLNNIPKSNLSEYIRLFKDKFAFRELLKDIYPDFYFKSVDHEDLRSLDTSEIKFPVVIKPSVGFLSVGVHTVWDKSGWDDAVNLVNRDISRAQTLFPEEVINSSKFLIETLVEGEEFAIDVYYDRNGEPVILNIFQHIFSDKNDVSDRLYVMSAEIMVKYMAKFTQLADNIGKLKDVRNFPAHIEVRVTNDGTIIPIEVNPMRFAGWCTADVSKYAWGINVYECFYNQLRPDWNEILSKASREIYYFAMAEVPSNIPRSEIGKFDYNRFLANFSNILELRRINFKSNPLFAIIFGSTPDETELRKIVELKTEDYITA